MRSAILAGIVLPALLTLWGTPAGAQQPPPSTVGPASEFELERPGDRYLAPFAPRYTTTDTIVNWNGYISVQVNVDPNGNNILGDAANEPSIAIDATNRQRMAIGWRQFDNVSSNFRQAGYGYTTDGGRTWRFPGVIAPGHFRSDPVLDSDTLGNLFYDSLTNEGGYHCFVHKSTDGGATWDAGVNAWGGDKQWLVIDRTGGVGTNFQYSFWTGTNDFTRSIDGGASFQNPIAIPNRPTWGTMDIGPNGELYIAGDGMKLSKSLNAQYSGQTPTFTTTSVSLGGGRLVYGPDPNPDGLGGQANVAVDRSNGPSRGNVYLLASVPYAGGNLDVMFTRSTDGGQTWSTPRRINDDPNPGSNWHWFGTMSVAPNSRIDVVWNDTRNNPGGVNSQLFYSYSEDAGTTWSPNISLGPIWNPLIGWPNQMKIGDYYHMISFNEGAHLAYATTYNTEQDVYYLHIPRFRAGDMNCDGVVNFDDINPFVLALSDPPGYAAAYPDCDRALGDVNGDGVVDFDDINPFVALLTGD
ncbi:MAG: hypothetical protein AB1716_02420 [Planctomycetota bacterium]